MNRARLMATLKRDEGLRLHPYRCSAGKMSLGYGRNLDDVGITEDEAEDMLATDVDRAIQAADRYRWFRGLSMVRQEVIVEMIFQLGSAGVHQFKRMRAAIKRGDWDRAADEMLDSKWAARDTPQRAARAAERMRRG